MKRLSLFSLLFLSLFLFNSCDDDSSQPMVEVPDTDTGTDSGSGGDTGGDTGGSDSDTGSGGTNTEFVVESCDGHNNQDQYDANRAFAFDLFNTMSAAEPEENIFVSPFSVSAALMMLYNGTNEPGTTQMEEVMSTGDMSGSKLNQNWHCLMAELLGLDEKVVLSIANSIWSRNDFTAKEDFLAINEAFLGSEMFTADFADPATVDVINQWISDNTEGLIKDALDEIPASAVMYLINAIYFNGTWKYAFDPEDSDEFFFHGLTETNESQTYMRQSAEYRYSRTNDFQAIDLPYGDDRFAMTIFMPYQDINGFISDLSEETFLSYVDAFETREVNVTLPKFDLEYKTLLNDPLKDMGMPSVFVPGSLENIQENYGLMVSRVIHQTFLDVSEEGTEAAAVTIIEIVETSAGPDTPESMFVNNPFFFVIREVENSNILFTGKVVNLD